MMNEAENSGVTAYCDVANSRASEVIKHHSRSFSMASRLLPSRVRTSVYALYAWCRTVDDAVDEAVDDQAAHRLLDILEDDLGRIVRGEPTRHAASNWIKPLVVRRQIHVKHAKELIAGMRMDLESFCVRNQGDLRRYCYHAAGTVGLMMTRMMGVREPAADHHAIALGVAMQLTNIARDVREDALRGRSYLPGISDPIAADPSEIRAAVAEVLATAERQYVVASSGLKYLPWSCRFAIRMALVLYREIGRQIVRNDYRVLEGRTVLSGSRLVCLVVFTLATSVYQELRLFYGRFASFLFGPSVTSVTHLVKELSMNSMNQTQSGDTPSTVVQAKHAVYLGLSLTSIMAAALFVMVFVNPKDASYSYLPLFYAGGSLVSGLLFNRLAARCEPLALAPHHERG